MIDERFAFITLANGERYQELRFENGQPVDWDEAATVASMNPEPEPE